MIINPALGKVSEDSEKLVLKFDIDITAELGKAVNLKTTVAKIFGLRASALQLLDIKEGCVEVTFQISKLVAQALLVVNAVSQKKLSKNCRGLFVV